MNFKSSILSAAITQTTDKFYLPHIPSAREIAQTERLEAQQQPKQSVFICAQCGEDATTEFQHCRFCGLELFPF